MSDDKIQVDTHVVEQLAAVADTMAGLLDSVSQRHENQSKDMDHFREDLALVRDSIRHIAKVLHEGNGEKPLISRVAVSEEKIDNLEDDVEKLELRQHEAKLAAEARENISKKGKYAVGAAVVSGIVTLVVEAVRIWG